MVMTVLFYAVIALFALVLVAMLANKLLHMWQAGVLMGGLYVIGTLILLAQMIVTIIQGYTMTTMGLLSIFAFVIALCGCYIHFRVAGTMIAPISAVIILLVEVLPQFLPALPAWMPLVRSLMEPWIVSATVLAAIGFAVATAYALLAAITFVRVRRIDDDTNELIVAATLKMPKMVSHFGWWSLVALSFAMGAYILWCHTIFGAYWLWQPYFAATAVVWLLVFVAKDLFMLR